MYHPVDYREHYQCQDGCRDQTADYDGGNWLLHLSCCYGHWDEPQACHECCHKHWANPGLGSGDNCVPERTSCAADTGDKRDYHEPV